MADESEGARPSAEERRAWPRYRPTHLIPVTFNHPRMPGMGAGDIVDLSAGGLRVVAPATVTTPLRWGEPVTITLAYSESTRSAGVEGMVLESMVVEVVSNRDAYTLRARFLEPLEPAAVEQLAGIVGDR